MTADENREVYKEIISVIGDGDVERLDALLAVDLVDHNPVPDQAAGRDGFKQWLSTARTSFPDLSTRVEDTVAERDRVAGRVTYRGTHRGPFLGLSATAKTVEFEAFHLVRFCEGRAVEWWGTADIFGALKQVGAEFVTEA